MRWVYTCVTGAHDPPPRLPSWWREPTEGEEERRNRASWRLVCFADKTTRDAWAASDNGGGAGTPEERKGSDEGPPLWRVVPLERLLELAPHDALKEGAAEDKKDERGGAHHVDFDVQTRRARFVKIQGWRFLRQLARREEEEDEEERGDSDSSVWIDGSMGLAEPPWIFAAPWDEPPHDRSDLVLYAHPFRSRWAEEVEVCLALFAPQRDRIEAQARTARASFAQDDRSIDDAPLFASGILFRRHTEALGEAMDAWWDQLKRFSTRDQLGLPVVLLQQRSRLRWTVDRDRPMDKTHSTPFVARDVSRRDGMRIRRMRRGTEAEPNKPKR